MNKPMCGASRDALPTDEQRKKLIDGVLEFADLLPPGPDRTRFLEVARSLSFLANGVLLVRGPNNVFEINMSSAVLHEIKQRAQKENVPLGQAITTWVKRAISSEGIGLN